MGKISGNYDDGDDDKPRRKSSTRARKLAEEMSIREVGNLDVVEDYIAQAEGIIKWEDLEVVLKREGWDYVRTRTYTNGDAVPMYDCHRHVYRKFRTKKKFLLSHVDGEGRKVHGAGPVRVPYNLPELLKRPDQEIDLVEGEDAVEALAEMGILASCVQGQNWTDDCAAPFYGRNVNVAMDNDDAGREATRKAVDHLTKAGAATIRVPLLPDLGPRQGLDDWLKLHTAQEYREIVAKTAPKHNALNAAPYDFPAENKIATYDWLHRAHVLRGAVSGTAATGGTGKSNLSIIEALEMTTGKRLLYGTGNGRKLRVVLINLEDNRNTMDKRIAAAMKHYKLTPADVGGRLIVIAKGEIRIKIARQEGGEVIRNESDIRVLTNLMIKNQGDVLSLDSFVRSHKVNENDNIAVTQVIECYEDVATGADCAVHLWHHTRKGNGDGATVESARGAQAFIDANRSIRILETMTKKERNDLLVAVPDIGQAGWYFREFNGKRNFAPPAEEFELVQVRQHRAGQRARLHVRRRQRRRGDGVGIPEAGPLGSQEPGRQGGRLVGDRGRGTLAEGSAEQGGTLGWSTDSRGPWASPVSARPPLHPMRSFL